MKERRKGMMLSEIPFLNGPVLFKSAGFDYFIIDTEHGGFDYQTISALITTSRLVNLECIIRLPDNTRRDIIRYMDMGADGLLLQMTNNAEDISKVVEYAKYYPLGHRGISTMRAHTMYSPKPLKEYMKEANEHTKIYAQIETVEGLRNAREILSVEGVNGFLMGPNDLSCDLGCIGETSERITEEIDRLTKISRDLHKESGIITSNKTYIGAAKRAGMELYCVGSELSMLKQSAVSTVKLIEE
ncbi:MAG: HpcH/HpaI aldolase/citrate lyase family protein [Christensenellales bacterium]